MHLPGLLLSLVFLTLLGRGFGITCYKCDSVSLPDCATSLESEGLPTEECKSAYSCALSIVDSVTYRGCNTNTPRGPVYYKTCTESLCNKGVYPPGRLKCHQCSKQSCIAEQLTKPTPCVNFDETDFCYTDVIDEIDTFRGCVSDDTRKVTDVVILCDTNGCNNLPAVQTLTCSKCDSHDARGCKMDLFEVYNASCVITNKTTCSDIALLGHAQPSCFLYVNLDHVVRGCTSESGVLSLDVGNFQTCPENLCNQKCLGQQKCIVCDSTINPVCISNTTSLIATTCEGAEASSCRSCQYKGGAIRRGCGVPSKTPDAHCNECQNDSCNNLNFNKCYKCTSDDSPNCGQWANPNIIDVEYCEIAGASCVSTVLKNGKTLRGCESPELTCNSTQASCFTCFGDLCNSGVYPATRLLCHHCDGREKCSNIVDNTYLLPCSQFDRNDACFEFLSARKTMVRGCRSESNLYYECLLASQDGNKCRLCAGTGCNKMPVKRPASLPCYKCSRKDEGCGWSQGSNETLEICQNPVDFPNMESCFTRRYADGSVSRGCTLDLNATEDGEFLESLCTDEGCNGKSQITQKCIVCEGNMREANNCTSQVGTMYGVVCNNGSMRFEERGCFMKIKGSVIQRGCASDLTPDELKSCQQSNEEDCHYCQGIECNTNLTFVTIRNSGFYNYRPSVAILLLTYLILIYCNI